MQKTELYKLVSLQQIQKICQTENLKQIRSTNRLRYPRPPTQQRNSPNWRAQKQMTLPENTQHKHGENPLDRFANLTKRPKCHSINPFHATDLF